MRPQGWKFIGNTSSDELTGHLPAYTAALLLARDAMTSDEGALPYSDSPY